jgi:Protein of unknown function (DUF1573)
MTNDRILTMRKIFLASLVLTGLLCAGALPAQENNGPRIQVKEIQYDFGKVAPGASVSHVFEVRNAGNEPLVIERIAAT